MSAEELARLIARVLGGGTLVPAEDGRYSLGTRDRRWGELHTVRQFLYGVRDGRADEVASVFALHATSSGEVVRYPQGMMRLAAGNVSNTSSLSFRGLRGLPYRAYLLLMGGSASSDAWSSFMSLVASGTHYSNTVVATSSGVSIVYNTASMWYLGEYYSSSPFRLWLMLYVEEPMLVSFLSTLDSTPAYRAYFTVGNTILTVSELTVLISGGGYFDARYVLYGLL